MRTLNRLKKWAMLPLIAWVSMPAFSASCQALTGFWVGQYSDQEGLFDPTPRSITLYLKSEGPRIFGYVYSIQQPYLNAIGKMPMFIFANCLNGKIQNLYFLPSGRECTTPLAQAGDLNGELLSLSFGLENPMMNTVLAGTFKSIPAPEKPNADWIKTAKSLSLKKINSCH